MARICLLIFVLLASPAVAQEVCPVKHPALTALDHASMLAAYTASFRGLFNRNPTLQPGSGVDDGNYWIAVSDHYGEFGDTICRAGWSAYWEQKLTGQDAVDPKLGDQPARFQPGIMPPPVPPVPPPLPPVPPDQLAFLQSIMNARFDKVDGEIAAVKQDVADFREAVRSKWAAIVKSPMFQIISGAIVTWATTYQVMKH